jgi:hypothetical protein
MKTIKEDIDKLTKLIQNTDEYEIGKNIITEMIKYESERTQKELDKIEVPICFYENDDGNKVYDLEAMAEEFENKLNNKERENV